MKKIVAIAMLFTISAVSISKVSAQVNLKSFVSQNNATAIIKGIDTVTNTATKTQTLQLTGYYAVNTVQATITKISGTVGGSISLKGSVDGIGYTIVGSAQTPTDVASQTLTFDAGPSKYQYFQVAYTGATTQVSSIYTKTLVRNPPLK